MMCSGPFRGAQGHSNLHTRTERRGPHGLEAWRSGVSGQSLRTAVLLYGCSTLRCFSIAVGIKFLLGAGGWGWGWGWGLGLGLGALGSTGLVLPATAQNPARLVYGSAALVASLRGQQSHFATLPINSFRVESFTAQGRQSATDAPGEQRYQREPGTYRTNVLGVRKHV